MAAGGDRRSRQAPAGRRPSRPQPSARASEGGSQVRVLVYRLSGNADLPLPGYATAGSAGADLAACIEDPVVIPPGGRAAVGTGLAIALPDGYEAEIRPRSGLAARHGLTLLNSPGTVDADYRGEVRVLLVNLGEEPVMIRRGERIAQILVRPVARALFEEVRELPGSKRGSGGFGHTGV